MLPDVFFGGFGDSSLDFEQAVWTLLISGDMTGGFQFDIPSQAGGDYTMQTSSSLAPPVVWQTLQTISNSLGSLLHVADPFTNTPRFYLVGVQ